jgi:SAM-dependent methyltransferase
MTNRIQPLGTAVLLLLCLAMSAWAQSEIAEVKKDVPYVPTPQPVVDRMLEMANVGSGDYLFDLGCGDGRIVVTAARDRGARGVGIDIDPQRISESKANAEQAGVTDKVEFRIEDLFETDFSEATVLTLYLLPTVNLELRPKILRELKPGSRVVSHDFDMGEWKADQSEMMDYSGIFFWVVPANVSGAWLLNDGSEPLLVTLDQEFQRVSGTMQDGDQERPLRDVFLEGDRLIFTVDRTIDGELTPQTYRGRVEGNLMTAEENSGGSWKAEREMGTERPLDEEPVGAFELNLEPRILKI